MATTASRKGGGALGNRRHDRARVDQALIVVGRVGLHKLDGDRPSRGGAPAVGVRVAQRAQQVGQLALADAPRARQDVDVGLLDQILGVMARAGQRPCRAVEHVGVSDEAVGVKWCSAQPLHVRHAPPRSRRARRAYPLTFTPTFVRMPRVMPPASPTSHGLGPVEDPAEPCGFAVGVGFEAFFGDPEGADPVGELVGVDLAAVDPHVGSAGWGARIWPGRAGSRLRSASWWGWCPGGPGRVSAAWWRGGRGCG